MLRWFIKVYRLWRGLADISSDLQESLLSGKGELIADEDAKQIPKEATLKDVYLGLFS